MKTNTQSQTFSWMLTALIPFLKVAAVLGLLLMPVTATALTATILGGQTVSNTTTTTTQVDQYSYTGTAGQILLVGFNWSNGTGTAEIYSQSGQLLTNVTASAGGKGLNFTLPSSETYMILVHDSSYNAVATYSRVCDE